VKAARAVLRVALCVAPLLAALPACAGDLLQDARREFDAGQYAEAKSTLLKIDSGEYRAEKPRAQASYALLRGLVMGALGDRTEAQAWLGLAKQTEERYPGSLSREDVARLKVSEEQYGPLLPTTAARP
jgi:Tfp pilus assembly protein PilF